MLVYKAMHPYDWTKSKGRKWTEPNDEVLPPIDKIARTAEFPAFHGSEPGIKIAGFFGGKEIANKFASNSISGMSAIYPAYLSLKNPYIHDAAGGKAGNVQFGATGKPFRDAMRSGKHDGAIIRNTADEGDIYVAMHPHQIKSPFNKTFDPNDDRLNFSRDFGPVEFARFDPDLHPRGTPENAGRFRDTVGVQLNSLAGVESARVSEVEDGAENTRKSMLDRIAEFTGKFDNKHTGMSIHVYGNGIRHSLQRGGDYRIVTAVKNLIENAILFATESHKASTDDYGDAYGDAYHLYAPLSIEGELHLASMVVKHFKPEQYPTLEDLRLHHVGSKKNKRLASYRGVSGESPSVTRDSKPLAVSISKLVAAVNEKYPQHVHEDLKKKFAHEFSRTDATGQSTFDWDEESHPRDDAGRFADKLHHQIKDYLMNGGQFGLPDIHNHTGHTDHDALDPLANPTTRALKSLVDADAISRTGPEHHNVRVYLTDEQRDQHEAAGIASEKSDATSDAKSEEKAQAGPAGLTKREAIAKASANKSGDKGLSHDEMVHATYLYTGTAPQGWPAVGFDMLLDDKDGILEGDESVFSSAKQAFPDAETMRDVFNTKGGPEWWKKNGTDLLKAQFLLQAGSRSWSALTSRVRNRIARRRSELISTSSFREDYRPFLKGATTARNTWPHSATEMSRDDYFGPVEFARKPAKGQVAFDFESPVESHLADAPGENVGTKQDQLFDVQESDVPPEHHEEAKALSEKHGGGEVRRLKNGDWQPRAPIGGKVSEVNVVFLGSLMESGVDFIAIDLEHANRLTLHILSAVAEGEARAISERTKAALQAKKARGAKLGSARPGHWNGHEAARLEGSIKGAAAAATAHRAAADEAYADLLPTIQQLRGDGQTLQQIADTLNGEGHTTRRGKPWNNVQVMRVLGRAN